MRPTADDVSSFWWLPWSAPLRAACHWLKRQPPAIEKPAEPPRAPRGIRPLCVQRWVGQAIAARLVWWRQHPDALPYRYREDSLPRWTKNANSPHDRAWLERISEASLLLLWRVDVERLLRLAETPPALVGEECWARACLGVSECLARLYHELKRRHRAMPARGMLREELRRFVTWEDDGEIA